MFKIEKTLFAGFSEKTKLVWVRDNGRLLVKVESTDLAEFKEAERMLKQTINNVHKQLNFPLSNKNHTAQN